MPRLTQAVPKYRLHRQSKQAIVTINGRDHLLGPHGTKASKVEYDRLVSEWLASGRSQSYGAPQRDYTIVELIADYLRYATSYYGDGPRSSAAAMKYAVRPLKGLYGRTLAAEFGPLQFKAVRQSLTGTDVSRSYVNQTMRKIAAVFRWGAGEGKIPPSIPQALSMVSGLRRGKTTLREAAPIQPVDDAVVDVTLPHLSPIVADMIRLQRLTGARPAEVCVLRPCDVDRSGEVWLYTPKEHKTEHHGRDRTIFIGPLAQAVLLRYLARDHEAFCFRPCDSMAKYLAAKHEARSTPLSCGNRPGSNRLKTPSKKPGDHYTTCSYRRAIHNACDKAFPHPTLGGMSVKKLPPEQLKELKAWQKSHRWAPNQLRHAAATEVRREFGLEAAQVILGHSQANVTQVYAERDLAKGLAVAKAIG